MKLIVTLFFFHFLFFFSWRVSSYWARASSFSRLHDHTQTHHTRLDSSRLVISPTQRILPDNTQQSKQTDVHAPGWIRTRNSCKRAAADPRLRPCGHWARPHFLFIHSFSILSNDRSKASSKTIPPHSAI